MIASFLGENMRIVRGRVKGPKLFMVERFEERPLDDIALCSLYFYGADRATLYWRNGWVVCFCTTPVRSIMDKLMRRLRGFVCFSRLENYQPYWVVKDGRGHNIASIGILRDPPNVRFILAPLVEKIEEMR